MTGQLEKEKKDTSWGIRGGYNRANLLDGIIILSLVGQEPQTKKNKISKISEKKAGKTKEFPCGVKPPGESTRYKVQSTLSRLVYCHILNTHTPPMPTLFQIQVTTTFIANKSMLYPRKQHNQFPSPGLANPS